MKMAIFKKYTEEINFDEKLSTTLRKYDGLTKKTKLKWNLNEVSFTLSSEYLALSDKGKVSFSTQEIWSLSEDKKTLIIEVEINLAGEIGKVKWICEKE